jgi:hypothetical protein
MFELLLSSFRGRALRARREGTFSNLATAMLSGGALDARRGLRRHRRGTLLGHRNLLSLGRSLRVSGFSERDPPHLNELRLL